MRDVATAAAGEVLRERVGRMPDGDAVEAVTLGSAAGVTARVLTLGATLQALVGPDRDGRLADVVLGHDDWRDYAARPNYLGVTVGRYANRIAGACFAIDGVVHRLAANDGANALHAGGFDRRNWRIVSVESGSDAAVTMALDSPDGDGGFPGALAATVTYALAPDGALRIVLEARVTRPTVVNLTNHALFNLAGAGDPRGTADHLLTVEADAFTPVDAALIPTGELRPVAGTPFDFREARPVADGLRDGRDAQIRFGRGYDHNFALRKGPTAEPEPAARLEDPVSGRVLDVWTTEPGVQLYAGNAFDGSLMGKGGRLYRMGDGIALEPQKFPDAPNRPAFVSARVDPDTPYRHVMIHRLSVRR